MYNPVSTYRVQFHKGFTFRALEKIIPYLQSLGVKTLYASPVFEATPGSMHGYDVTNPLRINPEIGTEEELRHISKTLKDAGIGWLQDIVPNHMAFHPGNDWLMDVLSKGKSSQYISFFDIGAFDNDEKLMVPFLGSTLQDVVDKEELTIEKADGSWHLKYYDALYPLSEESAATVERDGLDNYNNNPAAIYAIATQQHYRLCHWQETDGNINYRRFFTVNGLICLNIHHPQVFERYHSYIISLLNDGVFTGLRVDHIDGLYDPELYLQQLRELAGTEAYIVVEKILESGEALPHSWPVQGTTGYDFLSLVNNLFINQTGKEVFTRYYAKLAGPHIPLHEQLYQKKKYILDKYMQGELENITQLFLNADLGIADDKMLKAAIGEFLLECPVYRYYGNELPLHQQEADWLQNIFSRITTRNPELEPATKVLSNALLQLPHDGDEDYIRRALHFYQRCMQFTGPLMAKGMEDTLMYNNMLYIGNNDVGDAPETFGITREAFHKAMLERAAKWPLTMNGTSTHDTKRGEDARALLAVLTSIPIKWTGKAESWRRLNAKLKLQNMPDATDEYFIYQTLFATYPIDETEQEGYLARLEEYLPKALREGKRNSDWGVPDEAYETATLNFVKALLDQKGHFLKDFIAFRKQYLDAGMAKALAQVVVKFTTPGIPDTYQGTELWDQSLVDPDNRRAVDYDVRVKMLNDISTTALPDGWKEQRDGRIKLRLLQQMMQLRAQHQTLFSEGLYMPLKTTGRYARNIFAFIRRYQQQWVLVAVPLHLTSVSKDVTIFDWKDTRIMLPPHVPQIWQHLLYKLNGQSKDSIAVKEIFAELPLAVLRLQSAEHARGAGVLMPVSSLPSPYGIGDLGPAASSFARQLSRAGQKYWQLLPINPVSAGSSYSPYSSISSMAGSTLLISPELLASEGLLTQDELAGFTQTVSSTIDYVTAENIKKNLLDLAFARYTNEGFSSLKKAVTEFRSQSAWVEDFALYVVLKRQHGEAPWYEWPEQYRSRNEEALRTFAAANAGTIDAIVWQQAMFHFQWKALHSYCKKLGIQLIGDLPFYPSHDSCEVWTSPEYFSVNEDGAAKFVAGVPPDYFSETGQLWGMPTYKWDVMRNDNYVWWIERLRKNLELYDLLRIDHFRAFAEYWEVPAGSKDAVNGTWLKGPGRHFFDTVREALGKCPFIAEDLGDNMEKVYKLRDEIRLPGMKVLQFAFNEQLPTSVDAPHNYKHHAVVYTGTHDNNTTLGWFRKETKVTDQKLLSLYAGNKVNERNVNDIMAKLAYSSVAEIAILPMQDVLDLDEGARLNVPSKADGNWAWRMLPGAFTDAHIAKLLSLARFYNRI